MWRLQNLLALLRGSSSSVSDSTELQPAASPPRPFLKRPVSIHWDAERILGILEDRLAESAAAWNTDEITAHDVEIWRLSPADAPEWLKSLWEHESVSRVVEAFSGRLGEVSDDQIAALVRTDRRRIYPWDPRGSWELVHDSAVYEDFKDHPSTGIWEPEQLRPAAQEQLQRLVDKAWSGLPLPDVFTHGRVQPRPEIIVAPTHAERIAGRTAAELDHLKSQCGDWLRGLPFVSRGLVMTPRDPGLSSDTPGVRVPSVTIAIYPLRFPLARIIGADSFAGSWCGRDDAKRGGVVLSDEWKGSSLGTIVSYAHVATELLAEPFDRHLELEPFVDVDGELWCIAGTGGHHRLAAAKLRGDSDAYIAGMLHLYHQDAMPYVEFSVKELFQLSAP